MSFNAGGTLTGFILNAQPSLLKFLEFLLVAPWSDQWLINEYIGFPADFRNTILLEEISFISVVLETGDDGMSGYAPNSPLSRSTMVRDRRDLST